MHYKNPALTVDGVLFHNDSLLLIKRKNPPFKDCWALPGGFVEYGETTEHAIQREMKEETSLDTTITKLIGVYSDPNRDPRGHTISVVYVLQAKDMQPHAGDDAAQVRFFNISALPPLAFDHEHIIRDAITRR